MVRRETPGQRAAKRVGHWPSRQVSARHRLAEQHARSVWDQARGGAINRAWGLMASVDGDLRAFDGQVDLAFLATVAAHLERCAVCWKTWVDREVPVEMITAAVQRTEARDVFGAVLKEVRAQRRAR